MCLKCVLRLEVKLSVVHNSSTSIDHPVVISATVVDLVLVGRLGLRFFGNRLRLPSLTVTPDSLLIQL